MAVSFSTNFILKKMMRLDAKSEAQNHRYRARGVCVAAPNKTEQIPNSVVGGVGQSAQIPEPELIMSTGVAAVAVAIITWSAQKAEPLRQLCDDLGCYLLLDLSASCEAVNAEHICMSELVGAAVECVNMF